MTTKPQSKYETAVGSTTITAHGIIGAIYLPFGFSWIGPLDWNIPLDCGLCRLSMRACLRRRLAVAVTVMLISWS